MKLFIIRQHRWNTILALLSCLLLISCASEEKTKNERLRKFNEVGEYIYRKDQEYLFALEPPQNTPRASYPWEKGAKTEFPVITKEFFRCKGSSLNPARLVVENGKETNRYHDCGGSERHSLPIRAGKEFIYPILIDLLNYLQEKTGHQVVITSGHRCPEHNVYVDASNENQHSKHMIGAEVDFYIRGLENKPEIAIELLQKFYQEKSKNKGKKEYTEFQRFEKETNASVPPWLNKEIFIKLFSSQAGRTFDNRHPYSYISIQVRYDEETQEKVIYSWDKALNSFQRS